MTEKIINMLNDNDEDEIVVDFEKEVEEGEREHIPMITMPEWSDYVLGQFEEDEIFNGSPTVDGLRRVAEKLIGEIVSQKTTVVQAPDGPDKRATVVHNITFLCDGDTVKEFSGAADVYWGNCDKPFYKYPISTAETRAEGRALRRALKLRKVVAAEELSQVALRDEPPPEVPIIREDKITDTQLNFIEIMCKRLNLNVQKLVDKMYPGVYNIKELFHADSLALQKQLSVYQQDMSTIPQDIVGFEVDWKKGD